MMSQVTLDPDINVEIFLLVPQPNDQASAKTDTAS
jgi:hypothetical protein